MKPSINRTIKLFLLGIIILLSTTTTVTALDRDAALEQKCQEKNSFACFTIGEKLRTLDKNNTEALKYYVKACDGGWMTGCTNAGILKTLEGETHGDYQTKMKIWKQAGKYFTKACDAEENNACSNLGVLKYKEGRTSAAKKYYKKACDLGNNLACGLYKNLEK
ncbi:MAG: sel1 repeat family protein [Candidatus Nitronauta litoralis]|uniref:Sel1 repeat family protein n=1 Tax=Candidatus Nitronauta litoralis TaxID=2705533 RepID=A0A7T0G0Q9_9BACT|nr:MAG: sel1 repeat family protein [Candidatus Nitronauta litoralis]